MNLMGSRLVLVAGKGGVGRTTVTAALGLSLAAVGKRILLVEIGEVTSLGRRFGLEQSPYRPIAVRDNLWISKVTPREALVEYGLMKLKLKSLYRLVFDNPFTRNLVNMVPGMEELLLVGKIGYDVQQIIEGRPRSQFDMVVVDCPPTGQGLSLFVLPSTILAAVKVGPVAREVARIQELLVTPGITKALIVTLPEELAVDEALEMERELAAATGIGIAFRVVNKVIPRVCGPRELELLKTCLQARRAHCNLTGIYPLLSTALKVSEIRGYQQHELARLRRHSSVPIVELPLLPGGAEGVGGLAALCASLTPLVRGESA